MFAPGMKDAIGYNRIRCNTSNCIKDTANCFADATYDLFNTL